MKGITIPITAVVVIVLAVMILVILSMFFITSAATQMNRVEAEQVFAIGCNTFCKDAQDQYDCAGDAAAIYDSPMSTEFADKFIRACNILGYTPPGDETENFHLCLKGCGRVFEVDDNFLPPI